VQRVAGLELLVRVELEPALAALPFRTAVPGDADCLQPSARKRDQVLLQRIDPEGVADLILVERAVGALRTHQELGTGAREGGGNAEMFEPGVGKIAQHGFFCRLLHRQSVVRALPKLRLGRMASRTHLTADIARGLVRKPLRPDRGESHEKNPSRYRDVQEDRHIR
jgi:hypothetical protein